MTDEEFDDDVPDIIDADVLEEDGPDADVLDDDLEDDLLDVDLETEAVGDGLAVPAPAEAVEPVVAASEDEDEEGLDLDEELHPDDVEAPLDTLLQERTASATLEDEEDELEEEDDVDSDDRADGPTRIVPRRPGEFVCSSCFLVLPRHQLADERRKLCRDCA